MNRSYDMSRIKTAEESGIDIKTYKGKLYDGSYDLHNQTNVTNSYLTWEDALEALETEIRDHSPSERSYICNAHVCEIVECVGTNSRIVDPATCEFVESEYDTVDWKNKQKQWDIEKDYGQWDNTQESGVEVLLASTKKINEDWVTFVPSEGINFDFNDFTDSKFNKENKELTLYSENGKIDKLQWVSAKEIPDKIIDSYFGTESRDYSKISGFIEFLLDDLDLDKDKGCFDVCLLTLLEEIALKLRSIRDDS
jgi:hypothetical protein